MPRPLRHLPEDDFEPAESRPEPGDLPANQGLPPDQAALLALQQAVGNRAARDLLGRSGHRLPPGPRAQMEARFEQDFGDVQVHTGPEADAAAKALQAEAFAHGEHIGFANGTYSPGTQAGDERLAHELAHVVQQRGYGQPAVPGQITPSGHTSERQARAAAHGQPTALDAAPTGISLVRKDDPVTEQATTAPAQVAAATEDPALAAAREEAIGESIDIAETRARALLNSAYNDVQDAGRDFAVATAGDIDAMPGTPSGYWGLATDLVKLATGVISARFSKISKLETGLSLLSSAQAAGQTYVTSAMTDAREEPKAAAKGAMNTVSKAISYTQAGVFDELRDNVYSALVKLARTRPEAAGLLADGSVASIDQVLTDYVGIPNAGNSLYGTVREKMEVEFADWLTKQERRREFRHIGTEFGLPAHLAEPGRAAARSRVAEAVTARAGDEPAQAGLSAGFATIGQAAANFDEYFVMGWQVAMGVPEALAQLGDQTVDIDEDEVVVSALAEDEVAANKSLGRGIALADTRAREFLNSHYNDFQDAVRDFVSAADQQIDELPGSPTEYLALASNLFGGAMDVLASSFPPTAIGKKIAALAASAAVSGVKTIGAGRVGDTREARKNEARRVMQGLATSLGNKQAGIYNQARADLTAALYVAAMDPDIRLLLEDPSRVTIDAVISETLGIPHPDDWSVYADVRRKLDVPFHDWIQRERWRMQGLGYLTAFDPDTAPTERRIGVEAAARLGALDQEPSTETWYLDVEDEDIRLEDEAAQAQAMRDRLILKRVADADSRARGFINGHHDAVQDAVRDFVAGARHRIDAHRSKLGDFLSLLDSLSGALVAVMPALGGLWGAAAGAVVSASLQAVSSWHADKELSSKGNAKRAMRTFARLSELAVVSGFRRARVVASDALLSLALTDEDVGNALEIGGQDQIDAVIETGLQIPKPENATTYEDVRKALEEEFARWLSAQQGLDEAETEAAVAAALADAAEDAKLRRGGKDTPRGDKTRGAD
jgi:hypothetical protein